MTDATATAMMDLAAAMSPGGIEAMEEAGQRKLVATPDRLPIRGTIESFQNSSRGKWEAAGFVFGDPVIESGRPTIFVACAFPSGWKLVPTEHSMWSDVVDAYGKKRAAVFFKAAFYDYKAHTF